MVASHFRGKALREVPRNEVRIVTAEYKNYQIEAARILYEQEGPIYAANYLVGTIFANQRDKRGEPIVGHPRRVAAAVPEAIQAEALLHDVLEDNRVPLVLPEAEWKSGHLNRVGFSKRTTDILEWDTKLYKGEPRFDFAVRIGKAPEEIREDLIKVRLADIDDNCPDWRLTHLKPNEARDTKRAYSLMRGYLVSVFEDSKWSGVPFDIWMVKQPKEKQDWEMVRKHTARGQKMPADESPLPLPNRIFTFAT
jgi:hypothetical protein